MKIKLHYSLLGVFVIFLFTGLFYEFLIFIAIIIAHEFGHLIVCLIFKQKIKGLNITIIGGILDVQIRNVSVLQELLIYLSGVCINAILLVVSVYIKNDYYQNLVFNYNLLLIGFNLLPVHPLDGYKILEVLISVIKDPFKEQKILTFLSYTVLTLFSIYSILVSTSIVFWVISVYLVYQNMLLQSNKNNIVLMKIVKRYRYT